MGRGKNIGIGDIPLAILKSPLPPGSFVSVIFMDSAASFIKGMTQQ